MGGVAEAIRADRGAGRESPGDTHQSQRRPSFGLTVLCDGQRFAHVQRLREAPTLNELFGLQGVVSDDTLRRFAVGAWW